MLSFGSTGKNRELVTGMSRRRVARHKRIFATNNSPATPASARTGSGRDQSEPKKFLKLRFIIGVANRGPRRSRLARFRIQSNAGTRVEVDACPGNKNHRQTFPESKPVLGSWL